MEENGTYRWPGNNPQPQKKKPDFRRAGRTALLVAVLLVLVALAGTTSSRQWSPPLAR